MHVGGSVQRIARTVIVPVLLVGPLVGSVTTPVGAAGPGPTPATPYVVNGAPTTIAAHPFLAGILRRSVADPFTAQFCGGSVVAPTIVLTAAHCVDDRTAASLDVLTGATDLAVGEGVRTPVASLTVHPDWDDDTNQNDLAVLHLAAPVVAPPIDVVPPGDEALWAPPATAVTAGWGCTDVTPGGFCNSGGFPETLHAATVSIRDDATCAALVGEFFDAATMRCAGAASPDGLAADSCEGDSGGPLRVKRPGVPFVLVGIVSWGYTCGTLPGVYTRLEPYRVWLRAQGVPVATKAFVGRRTPNVALAADRPFACDVDGDGYDDEVLYATGAAPDVIRYGGPNPFAREQAIAVGGTFTPVAGDFDGDGDCDVLWYRPGAAVERLWRGSPVGFYRVAVAPVVERTYAPAVGDFDGDGRDDVLWYDPTGGPSRLWFGRTGRFLPGPTLTPPAGATPVALDLDGDGADDVWFDQPEPGPDELWRGGVGGLAVAPSPGAVAGDGPLLAGDFDGDGADDLLRDLPSGRDELWRGAPSAVLERRTRPARSGGGFVGLVGDLDGDGRDDVHWYQGGAGVDVLWLGVGAT